MAKKKERGLTPKQRRFVEEYLIDLNATAAARRAGYSEKTADRIGPELLGKTCVSNAIEAAQKKRSARTEVTQDRVILELARIAFLDPRKVFKWGPEGVTLLPSDGLTPLSALSSDHGRKILSLTLPTTPLVFSSSVSIRRNA